VSSLTYFKGTFYGTTTVGGGNHCGRGGFAGCGTVYSITPSGTETVLRSLGGKYGADPAPRLIVRNGTFYGTTQDRGGGCPQVRTDGCGTVFSITPSGHETVLHAFTGPPDGWSPSARLLNVNGTLYGLTEFGGSHVGVNCPTGKFQSGCGTVFSIIPGGEEKVLYSFRGGTDAEYPGSGFVDVNGTLYSTTSYGGAYGDGTFFSITLGGKEKVLYSFGASYNNGRNPSGLVDVSGTLYGTTGGGGAYNNGTVFSITPGGKEKVLYSFGAHGNDGDYPIATLLNVNGTLYGTTYEGGRGLGTVFSITLSGHETVLHSFGGSVQDGSYPYSGLSYVNGTFYGTTSSGGANDSGTVYSITP
jgi:uncharacterized repeat protein (TIGR03803 family)